jgi:hypothetical protein
MTIEHSQRVAGIIAIARVYCIHHARGTSVDALSAAAPKARQYHHRPRAQTPPMPRKKTLIMFVKPVPPEGGMQAGDQGSGLL